MKNTSKSDLQKTAKFEAFMELVFLIFALDD